MNLKKFLSLLLILCLAFSFVACGTRRSGDDDDDGSVSSSRRNRDDDDDDDNGKKSKDKEKDDKDDKDVKVDRDDDDDMDDFDLFGDDHGVYTEGSIPKGYPKDKFPIFEGGEPMYGYEYKNEFGAKTYSLSVFYKNGDIDTINGFYRDYLKPAEYYVEEKQDYDGLLYYHTGKLNGYSFFFTVTEDPVNNGITVFIDLEEIPSASNVLKEYEKYGEKLPSGYPENLFPIIDDGIIAGSYEGEIAGKTSYTVKVYTDKSFREIIDFYESVIGDIKNKYKYMDEDSFTLSGEIDNYHFAITGYTDILEEAEVSCYEITFVEKE